MTGKQIGALVAVLVAIFIAYNSYFIVTPRERVLVVEMGAIVGANYPPGIHFKIPFIQKAYVFDDRIRTFTSEIERVLTTKNKNISVTYYLKWRISDTVEYYLATHGRGERAQQLLSNLIRNELLAAISKRTIKQVVGTERNQLLSLIQIQVGEAADKYGIELIDVRFLRLSLPKGVTEAVYERMRTERQEVIRTLRAEGDAVAKRIRAEAQRERSNILAEAYRQAQEIKGAGDAKAAEIYAKASQAHPQFYSFYRTLEVYRNTVGPGDLLLLPPEGRLFQYFNPPVSNPGVGESDVSAGINYSPDKASANVD